jgi:hypothetical protein
MLVSIAKASLVQAQIQPKNNPCKRTPTCTHHWTQTRASTLLSTQKALLIQERHKLLALLSTLLDGRQKPLMHTQGRKGNEQRRELDVWEAKVTQEWGANKALLRLIKAQERSIRESLSNGAMGSISQKMAWYGPGLEASCISFKRERGGKT